MELPTGTPGTIQPDDTAAEGTATSVARSDHVHAIVAAAPAQGIGGGNSEGTATSFARSDHNHTIRETGGPTDLAVAAIADGEVLRRSGTSIVGTPPFLGNYQKTEVLTRTTTTGEDVVKATLTTPALTGTFLLQWSIILDANNKECEANLYNLTDATEVDYVLIKPSNTVLRDPVTRFVEVVLTGTAKTFQLRFGNSPGNNDPIGGGGARMYFWRALP